MRPATRAGLVGNASLVGCDVQQICREISGGFGSARVGNAWADQAVCKSERSKSSTPEPIKIMGEEFETGQF